MMNQWDHILLEPSQRDLLTALVEAARRTPIEKRRDFWFDHGVGDARARIRHPGLHGLLLAHESDLQILERERLVLLRYEGARSGWADVTPRGQRYFDYVKQSAVESVAAIESEVMRFLDQESFTSRFPQTTAKWLEANAALATARNDVGPSTVGHLAREAMQEFAAELSAEFPLISVTADKTKTANRLHALVQAVQSKTTKDFAEALITYWRAVSDLVQALEHSGLRESTQPSWEDARRVIFQSAIVMYEVASVLPKPRA